MHSLLTIHTKSLLPSLQFIDIEPRIMGESLGSPFQKTAGELVHGIFHRQFNFDLDAAAVALDKLNMDIIICCL
jgi:hypothetical protein